MHDEWCGELCDLPLAGQGASAASEEEGSAELAAWLGEGGRAMAAAGVADAGLLHVARRVYRVACDWKVYCDNFLVRVRPCSHEGPAAYAEWHAVISGLRA